MQVTSVEMDLIINSDATTLRDHIVNGRVSCQQAVAVFSLRCFTHGRALNAVHQEYYEQAMQIARDKDDQLKEARANGTVD